MIQEMARVRLRNDPSVVGFALAHSQEIGGKIYQRIRLIDGTERNVPLAQLEELEAEADPIEDLRRRRWSAPEDLARRLTHVRLTGRLADLIYSMESTNTAFHAYQFKPVIKVLNAATKGLLIADEVGLGKTIEAGLVWTELVARYSVRRLLVVCPKSLQQKWRSELRQKFSVISQIQDAQGLATALAEGESGEEGFAIVASLSALRPPRGWDDADPPLKSSRADLARFLSDHADQEPLIDLVIFDEAHHLRNPETQQHKLAQLLVDVSDYRLLLSATPINLHSGDLQALLKLLDPDLFQRDLAFDQLQRENEPILAARQKVLDLQVPLREVAEELQGLTEGQLLKTNRRLELLRRRMGESNQPDGPAYRAELAARLEEMSMLGGIVNRTRRRDVNEIQVVRRAHVYSWEMNPEERAFYEEATEVIRQYALTLGLNERFLLATAQRLIASSLPAAYAHWRSKAQDFTLDDEDEEEEAETSSAGPLTSRLAAICLDPERERLLRASDSKLQILQTALGETWQKFPDEKVIVFSSFRRTIDYLHERLSQAGVEVIRLHGSIDEDRDDVLRRFEDAKGPTVLLTSEVGGEGLDLQFCRILINYDLPWNPMRVEQRIGRIDRIGQASPSVDISSLICKDTIEERVYRRLYERLELIVRTLGGFEAILGQEISHMERKLLDPDLSPEEKEAEVQRAATAIEARRIQEDNLEKEAPALIAHGDMILNRIRVAHEQQKWIHPDALFEYVHNALRGAFPATTLNRAPTVESAFELRFSPEAHVAFVDYLSRRARQYPTGLRAGTEPRRIVFGRADTRQLRSVEAVPMSHPLVRFCAELIEDAAGGVHPRPAVAGALADPGGIGEGRWALTVQRWSASGVTPQEKLVTAAVRLSDGEVLSGDDAEALTAAFVSAPYRPLTLEDHDIAAAVQAIKEQLDSGVLARDWKAFVDFEAATHSDKHATRIAVLEQQRDLHQERVERRIADLIREGKTRIIPAERGKLARFMARMNQRIADANRGADFTFAEPETLGVAIVDVVAP